MENTQPVFRPILLSESIHLRAHQLPMRYIAKKLEIVSKVVILVCLRNVILVFPYPMFPKVSLG